MKKQLLALALAGFAAAPVLAGPSVGVSIGINQPGVYGRINIGDYPQPALVYANPVIAVPGPVAVRREPVYLYVPPLYQQHWRRYCGRYNACGQPVYFVQERWVRDRWEHERHGWHDGRPERFERDHGRGDAHWDRGRHDDDHRGHDEGRGHDGHHRDH